MAQFAHSVQQNSLEMVAQNVSSLTPMENYLPEKINMDN